MPPQRRVERSRPGPPESYGAGQPPSLVLTTFESELPNMHAKAVRRAYLATHALELLLAVAAVISAITFLVRPESLADTPIGRADHPFDFAWNILYLVGALAIGYGLLRPSPRIEAAGLYAFTGAILGEAAAVIDVRGVPSLPSALTFVALALAFLIRVRAIRKTLDYQRVVARLFREGGR